MKKQIKQNQMMLYLIMSMCIEATTSSSGDNSNLSGLCIQFWNLEFNF